MVNKECYYWESGDLLPSLHVQTGASVDKFAEILEDRIKLRIKAASVNGKANEAIIKFLSKEFRTPKSYIQILRGKSSRKSV
jgi:uncharacterized protein (TIGR00251 family)